MILVQPRRITAIALEHLHETGEVTAPWLAEAAGCTVRTALRTLRSLADDGFLVTAGPRTWYRRGSRPITWRLRRYNEAASGDGYYHLTPFDDCDES